MSMPSFLLMPDAGPHRGLGHLQRTLALTTALANEGARCILAAPSLAQDRVEEAGIPFRPMPGEGPDAVGARGLLSIAAEELVDVIVVDSYHLSLGEVAALREAGLRVIAIVDEPGRPTPAHVLLNPDLDAPQQAHPSLHGDTRFLLGPDFALLRMEYWTMPRRTVRPLGKRLLVTFGGTDGRGMTPLVLGVLAKRTPDADVTITLGPHARNGPAVRRAAALLPGARVVHAPASLRDLLVEADVVLGAAGQTLHEVAATGTPGVAVQVADNQARHLAAYARHGIVVPVPMAPGEPATHAVDLALSLLEDAPTRARMAERGQRLVDGRGALRAATEILATIQT